MAQAAIHGYTTAFTVSAGVFAAAAVGAGLLFTRTREEAGQSQRPIGYSIDAWAAAIRAIGTR
ncbi:MAG TPA: hypothetical protein VGF68_05535 [Solirubrobacteraceae bacterium]